MSEQIDQALEVAAGLRSWAVVEADWRELLEALPQKSVDHVITDPPYEKECHEGARRSRWSLEPERRKGTAKTGHGEHYEAIPIDFEPMTEAERLEVSRELARVSRGWILAFGQLEAIGPWRDALRTAGAKWRRAAVWVKPDGSPQLNGNGWAQASEAICAAWAGRGDSRWNGGGRRGFFLESVRSQVREKDDHPTVKPLRLMLELVDLFTSEGQVILDPYGGSGTTGIAALRLGRRVIICERQAHWAKLARERLEAEARGSTPRAARAGQVSIFDLEGVSL